MTAGALTFDKSLSSKPLRWATLGEFLVTGGATLLLIPLAHWYQTSAGLEHSQYIVSYAAFYAAFVINDPHFAVSYLLFYKNLKKRLFGDEFRGVQRVRYIVSGFVVPVALVAWIAVALTQQSAAIMGGMIQLMFFLVGWHYVKQGFGVLTVLSARRGVRFSALERNVLLTHCFSGWAYAWCSPREHGGTYEESGVVYTALAHPPGLEELSGTVFVLSTLALITVVGLRIRNRQALPPLAASCGFLMSIWLWTVYSGFDPLIAYVIPGLHSLQYWYFVYLLKSNEAKSQLSHGEHAHGEHAHGEHAHGEHAHGEHAHGRVGLSGSKQLPLHRLSLFFVTAILLAWLGFNGIPSFLDEHFAATTARMGQDPEVSTVGLGVTPYVAAFATFINIHHYFMDHVIWRRENPDTRFLRN